MVATLSWPPCVKLLLSLSLLYQCCLQPLFSIRILFTKSLNSQNWFLCIPLSHSTMYSIESLAELLQTALCHHHVVMDRWSIHWRDWTLVDTQCNFIWMCVQFAIYNDGLVPIWGWEITSASDFIHLCHEMASQKCCLHCAYRLKTYWLRCYKQSDDHLINLVWNTWY